MPAEPIICLKIGYQPYIMVESWRALFLFHILGINLSLCYLLNIAEPILGINLSLGCSLNIFGSKYLWEK